MKILTQFKDRYRYSIILLKQLVKTDFKLRYQNSVLGYVWSLLKPSLLFVILYTVFSILLRFGDDIPNYGVYLLLGIVVWSYFSEVSLNGVTSIVNRGDLLRKINFPKYVIVLAGSFSSLINFAINMVVVSVFIVIADISINMTVLWLPLLVIELFILALSFSFLLSAMYVRLRDVSHIWEVILQGAFYATPILYPLQLLIDRGVSQGFIQLMMINPMAQIIQDFRYILVTNKTITIDHPLVFGSHAARLIPISLVLLLGVYAARYFRKQSKTFAEEL